MTEQRLLQTGDVIIVPHGAAVYATVPTRMHTSKDGKIMPKGFAYRHRRIVIEGPFAEFAGRYIVTRTTLNGGSERSNYPDGHRVFCQKVVDPHTKVDFYQTGYFTAVIKDPEVIGLAKCTWEIVELFENEKKDSVLKIPLAE